MDSVVGLEDLPERRREELLLRYATELDYDGVEDLVAGAAGGKCGWFGRGSRAILDAVLGEDQRYHLRQDGRSVLCRGRRPRRQPGSPPWPPLPVGTLIHFDGTLLRLTETCSGPELVPPGQRCGPSWPDWPPYHDPLTPRGPLRIALAAALGPHCHACRHDLSYTIDHDHHTGKIRGLLCRNCNTHIDKCPHLTGCHFADYLNHPPAAHLNLTYPNRGRRRLTSTHELLVHHLGFDPRPGVWATD